MLVNELMGDRIMDSNGNQQAENFEITQLDEKKPAKKIGLTVTVVLVILLTGSLIFTAAHIIIHRNYVSVDAVVTKSYFKYDNKDAADAHYIKLRNCL